MKRFVSGDVAVVTGPLRLAGTVGNNVYFDPGDVVEVIDGTDIDGDVFASRRSDGKMQFIDSDSLTPFDEIAEDPSIDWGELEVVEYEPSDGLLKTVRTAPWLIYKESPDLLDPNLVRDYVYEGDDE